MGFRLSVNNKSGREGSVDNRTRGHAKTLVVFWLQSLLGVALVTFLGGAALVYAWTANEKADALDQLQGWGAVVVRDIEKRVSSLRGRLRDLGADAQLRSAFAAASAADLRATEKRLARAVPDALEVHLAKPGACTGKMPQTKSFSYAGLDLVCQAERQRNVTLLEVHRPGSPEEHLAIAAPVFDANGETVLGVVHVALPPSLLPSLKDANGAWGFMGYQQRVADKAVTLGSVGGATMPSGAPDYQIPIEGTRLRVAVWIGNRGVIDTGLLPFAILTYLVLMALLALAMWLPLLGVKRALTMDHGGIVALVEDAMNRKPLRHLQCRLAETKPLIDTLIGLLGRLQLSRALQPAERTEKRPVARQQAAAPTGPGVAAATDTTLGARGAAASKHSGAIEPVLRPDQLPARIFGAQGIRGVASKDLTADVMHAIGLAVGTEAVEAGDQTVIVGRDTGRTSQELSESLFSGLRASGCDVLDVGVVPTPLIYFATRYQGEASGVMVTSSHNSESDNALKIVVSGKALTGEQIMDLRERILAGSFSRGNGGYRIGELVSDYVDQAEKDIAIARTLRVVVDCGNAAAALVAPRLYQALGCDLIELDYEPDIGFSDDRIPDPTCPAYLENLRQVVVSQGADIGLAFNSDGDRLGVVDSSGKIIWPDRVLMLLAADVLSRYPGADVVFDGKCSSHLATEILRQGGRPVMCKSDPEHFRAKLRETDALLAGDFGGHIILRERWHGFDDALYSGARLIEVLALDTHSSAEIFAALPGALATPELFLDLTDGEAEPMMKAVLEEATQTTGIAWSTEDGLRAESEQGWGYVRISNTRPALAFRFEANDKAGLSEIQDLFRHIMERAAPNLPLPF